MKTLKFLIGWVGIITPSFISFESFIKPNHNYSSHEPIEPQYTRKITLYRKNIHRKLLRENCGSK